MRRSLSASCVAQVGGHPRYSCAGHRGATRGCNVAAAVIVKSRRMTGATLSDVPPPFACVRFRRRVNSDPPATQGVSPDVSSNVSPLRKTSTERVRLHRERKKAGITVESNPGCFRPGNPVSPVAAVRHGAYTPELVEAVAKDIIADLLARPSCPRRLVEDPDDELLELWATSMAVCRLLRASLTTQNIEAALTEQLSEDETTVRPAMGAAERSLQARRRQPVLDALHKHQSQALHLAKALGLDAASRRAAGEDQSQSIDYARYWAARSEHRAQGAEGSAG